MIMWNFSKKKDKIEDHPIRRPFTFEDKIENLLDLYNQVDDLLFETRTEKSKRKKYYE